MKTILQCWLLRTPRKVHVLPAESLVAVVLLRVRGSPKVERLVPFE